MRMSHRRSLYGGGIPPVPASWTAHGVVASTGSWSPDTAGWYRFYVIGQGGNGGSGDYYRNTSFGITRKAGGGGGGTGGVAIHQLYLTPGNSVSITVDTTQTELSYGEETVTATAGTSGQGGNTSGAAIPGTGGEGGSASGGNVSNIAGAQGSAGGATEGRTNVQGGGGGTPTAEMKYVVSAPASSGGASGAAAPYSTDDSAPQMGGGGAGGSVASRDTSGGAGAPGGVVIEAGA